MTNNHKKSEIQLPQGFEWQEKKRFEVKRADELITAHSEILDKSDFEGTSNMRLQYITAEMFNIPMQTIDNTSICYILKYENEILSIAVINELNKNTIELQYIETISEKRNKGYASRLIKSLVGNYKQKYKEMIIGSNSDTIPFFVKNGFDEFVETKEGKNYYKKRLN